MRKLISVQCFYSFFIFYLTWQLFNPQAIAELRFQLEYHEHQISLSAENAELKDILQKLNEESGISMMFPDELQNTVSINLSDIEFEKALPRILKGLNYITVYYTPTGSSETQISEVRVFSTDTSNSYRDDPTRPHQSTRHLKQVANSITSYEKRIKDAQQHISGKPKDSPVSRRYQLQIRGYKRIIERLKSQVR